MYTTLPFPTTIQYPIRIFSRAYVVLNNCYYVSMAILCLEISASWDSYGRPDLAAWSALSIVACIVNIYSLSSRNKGSVVGKEDL